MGLKPGLKRTVRMLFWTLEDLNSIMGDVRKFHCDYVEKYPEKIVTDRTGFSLSNPV